MREMVVVDLDGTLTISEESSAINCLGATHSKEEILRVMDPVKVARLSPRLEVIERVRELRKAGNFIVIVTGRWDYLEEITQSWLKIHEVPIHLMAMRRHRDWQMKSVDVKLSAFKDIQRANSLMGLLLNDIPVTWIDDDQEMLDALPSHVKRVKV